MSKRLHLQSASLPIVIAIVAVTTIGLAGVGAQRDSEEKHLGEESEVPNSGRLLIASSGDLDFLITDPLGKRTGIDPNTGAEISEIFDAAFRVDSIGEDAAGGMDESTTEINIFETVSPIEGTYQIDIHSASATQYDLKIYSHDRKGSPNRRRLERGSMEPGQIVSVEFHYSPFPAVRGTLAVSTAQIGESTFDLYGSFTLGETSNGIDLLAESATLGVGKLLETTSVGSFTWDKRSFRFESVTLRPGKLVERTSAGSFTTDKRLFRFKGQVGGVKLDITVTETGDNSFNFSSKGEGADLQGTPNPVKIRLSIGDDILQTSVMADLN